MTRSEIVGTISCVWETFVQNMVKIVQLLPRSQEIAR